MKKSLSVVLLLVLCIGCLASCSIVEGWFGGEEKPEGNIEGAAAILETLVTKDAAEPVRNASFDVPTTVILEEISYSVVWTVDDARIKITDGRKEGFKTIVIPDVNKTEFSFVLTAAITGAGQEKTIAMRIKCPVKQDIGAAEGIEVNKPYLLAMEQINIEGKPTLYATGSMYQYWFALTENKANGVNFYFEETTGGYHMYAKLGETKNYVNVVLDGTYVNCVYAAEAATVWTWDNTLKTAVTNIDGTSYLLGAKKTNKNLTPLATTEVEISIAKIVASANADRNHFYVPSVEGAVKPVTGQKYTLTTNLDFDSIYYATGANATDKNGAAKDYWLAFDKDITKAANFYVEEVTGGYNLYAVVNGAKKYVNIIKDGKYISSKYQDTAASVWTWNETLSTLTVTIDSVEYVLATQGHQNLSAKSVAEASYCAQFVVSTLADQTGSGSTGGDETTLVPSDITSADAIKENTAYKFYLYQSQEGKNYYLAGGMNGYFMATTTDPSAAVDVYAEIVEGGFKLYYNDASNTKQYLAVAKSDDGEHTNAVFNATGSVFTFNTEYKTFVTTLTDGKYFLGTYGTYKTFGASAESHLATSYAGHLATLVEDTTGGEGGEGDDTTPEYTEMTIANALAAEANAKVKVTGKVTFIKTAWANNKMSVFISDESGIIFLYNIATEVALGDTVTVEGTRNDYKGLQQLKECTVTKGASDADYTVTFTEMTIAQALAAAVGTPVQISGTITKINGDNITLTSGTDSITLYKLGTTVGLGDTVTVKGVVDIFNSKQITTGTAVISVDHSEAGCTYGEDNKCTVCGSEKPIPGQTTVIYNIAAAATANSWTVGGNSPSKITEHTFDSIIAMAIAGGTNSGKIYSDGVRVYQTESPKITITAATGYEIVSVTVTYTVNNSGILTHGTATINSNASVAVNAASVEFSVGNTDETVNNGQVRISEIKVVYTVATVTPPSDAEKVAADKEALKIENLAATGAGTATLPEAVADGNGCTITWAVDTADAAKATISGATITFTSCRENTTVKVIATIKSGDATATKDFTFNVTADNPYTDAEKVALDKAALNPTLAVSSSSTTTLPLAGAHGTTITYEIFKDDAAKATLDGANLKFAATAVDTTVTVTATIKSGEVTDTADFVFTVTATDADKLAADKAALTFTTNCNSTATLPTTAKYGSTIAWELAADDTTGATLEGTTLTVSATSTFNLYVKVKATLTLGDLTDTKELTITATGNKAPAKDYTADDFDDKTTDSALEGVTVEDGVSAGYVNIGTETEPNMVLSATLTGDQKHIKFTNISSEVCSASKATALEISFDIKIDTPNNDNYASVFTSFYQGSTRKRIGIFNYYGKIAFRNYTNNYAWTFTDVDFPEDGWFNIRIVIYQNDNSNRYYYINGSQTPVVEAIGAAWDITKVTNFDFWLEGNNSGESGTNIQFDNVFFGYIEPRQINYRDEADDFADKTTESLVEGFDIKDSTETGVTAKYVEDATHGIVLSTTYHETATFEFVNKNTTLATADTATALELSFDMKLEFNANSGQTGYQYIMCSTMVGDSRMQRIAFFDKEGHLDFRNYSNDYAWSNVTLPISDWIHVRMVWYEGDTNTYYYIDGNPTPIIIAHGGGYTVDISEISAIRFERANTDKYSPADTTIKFDNLFFGYTTDVKPQ